MPGCARSRRGISRCSSRRELRPDDDPQVAAIKQRAAATIGAGDYTRAEALLRSAFDADLAAAQRAQDVTNKRFVAAAKTRAELGQLNVTQLRYAAAIEDFREAASLVPPGEALVRSDYLNRLGRAAQDVANFSLARTALAEALGIRERLLDAGHPDIAVSLNNLALLLKVTRLRRGGAALSARAGDPREELRTGPSDRCDRAQQSRRAAAADQPAAARRSRSTGARRRSTRRAMDLTIQSLRSGSTTSRYCCRTPTGRPRRSRSSGARWRSTRRATDGPSRCCEGRQQPRRAAAADQPAQRGGAALPACAGDQREELRTGPSDRRDKPQQPRRAATGHQPAERGGAALPARAGHEREELRTGPPGRCDPTRQLRRPVVADQSAERGGAALPACAGDRREELRTGPSGHEARQGEPAPPSKQLSAPERRTERCATRSAKSREPMPSVSW